MWHLYDAYFERYILCRSTFNNTVWHFHFIDFHDSGSSYHSSICLHTLSQHYTVHIFLRGWCRSVWLQLISRWVWLLRWLHLSVVDCKLWFEARGWLPRCDWSRVTADDRQHNGWRLSAGVATPRLHRHMKRNKCSHTSISFHFG